MIKITKDLVKKLLPLRKPNTHKYDYGHVLIIAGSKYFTGAGILSANSAIRAGAGLVTLVFPKSLSSFIYPRLYPEVITLPCENDNGLFNENHISVILEYINKRKVTSLAIGPGLTTEHCVQEFVMSILKHISLPTVLDADGLNCISGSVKNLRLPFNRENLILTPHPGELSKLVNEKIEKIGIFSYIKKIAKLNKCICVLKQHHTLITDGDKVYFNPTGNPGMATGGSGDVLTGIISALIKQVKDEKNLNAAIVGVYVHGLSGDIASKNLTQISMLPTDIIEFLPQAFKLALNE